MTPRSFPPVAFTALRAACSGGGGESSRGPVPFTAFSAIGPNDVVVMSLPDVAPERAMINHRASFDSNDRLEMDTAVITAASSGLRLTFDRDARPSQARLTIGFDDQDPPVREPLVRTFDLERPAVITVPADPSADDYLTGEILNGTDVRTDFFAMYANLTAGEEPEYMTFGIWALDLLGTHVDLGAATWGVVTPSATIPSVTNATYEGGLLGTLVDTQGEVTHYEARSMLAVNFNMNTVSLSASDTYNIDTGDFAPELDLSTNAAAARSGNSFANGTLSVNGAAIAGDSSFSGAFFGPDAEEAAGIFTTTSDLGHYFGAFGGKRPIDPGCPGSVAVPAC